MLFCILVVLKEQLWAIMFLVFPSIMVCPS